MLPSLPAFGLNGISIRVASGAGWGDTERRHEIAEFPGGELRWSLRHHQTEAGAAAHGGADAGRIPADLLRCPDQPDRLDALWTAALGRGRCNQDSRAGLLSVVPSEPCVIASSE